MAVRKTRSFIARHVSVTVTISMADWEGYFERKREKWTEHLCFHFDCAHPWPFASPYETDSRRRRVSVSKEVTNLFISAYSHFIFLSFRVTL